MVIASPPDMSATDSRLIPLLLLITVSFTSGCGPSRLYMTPSTTVRPDSLQITDERIREAFSQRPQLVDSLNVAVYSAGTFRTSLPDSLLTIDKIQSVYEISPALIEQDRHYRSYRGWRSYSSPRTAPLKELRLLAAQGHADLLVFFSASHRFDDRPNWLAATYTLLIPAFFVPGRHATLTTNIDVFFIDVRNGFLYANYHDRTTTEKRYVQLGYEHQGGKDLAAKHVNGLLPDVLDATRRILHTDRFYHDSVSDE